MGKQTIESGGDSGTGRKRLPAPVLLRLRPDLAPNANHPLANVDPVRRGKERERIIASILARLASGPPTTPENLDILQCKAGEENDLEDEAEP
ncbi:MAG: hypothetical protein U0936_26040 [Planctomycetaceae bacterium]